MNIWNKRSHYSEISGIALGAEISTGFFHHILPKRSYKEAEYDEDNIVLLTLSEHEKVEADMYCSEIINKRREYLKLKYGIQDRESNKE